MRPIPPPDGSDRRARSAVHELMLAKPGDFPVHTTFSDLRSARKIFDKGQIASWWDKVAADDTPVIVYGIDYDHEVPVINWVFTQ